MSPRAAWRLEAARFGPVYDYAAGKADWLADDQPFDGTAQLVGTFTRRDVATAVQGITAAEALRLLNAQGFGPVLVVNQAGVVMGAAYRDKLAAADGEADVQTVMRFGVSTVRPSEDAVALARRMGDRGVTRVVVTRPDGTLAGLFFAADINLRPAPPRPACRQPGTPAPAASTPSRDTAAWRALPGSVDDARRQALSSTSTHPLRAEHAYAARAGSLSAA
jgi:CBS domain-containing protein